MQIVDQKNRIKACRQYVILTMLAVCSWFAALLVGCTLPGTGVVATTALNPDQAMVTIYLETKGSCSSNVRVALSDFVLYADQQEFPLYWEPIEIDARSTANRQLLLGLTNLPEGYYGQLGMTLRVLAAGGEVVSTQTLQLRFPQTLFLEGNDRSCLFMTWHLEDCRTADGTFAPKFTARSQDLPLARDLLYVLCQDLQTLYLVRTDTDRIVASVGLDGQIVEMALDAGQQRLYLLNQSQRSVQVFDLASGSVIDRLPLPMTLEPSHLALDTERNAVFVSDAKARRVIRLDLDNGQVTGHQDVGLKPERLLFVDSTTPLVAVVAPLTQSVFLLDAETLEIRRVLSTGSRPQDVAYVDDRLFVSEAGSQVISVYALATGAKIEQVRMDAPGELLTSAENRLVYVGSTQAFGLRMIRTDQVTSLRTVVFRAVAGAFAAAQQRGRIYVADLREPQVMVFDQVAERVVAVIPLGGRVNDLISFE